jgi:hypothetical protein
MALAYRLDQELLVLIPLLHHQCFLALPSSVDAPGPPPIPSVLKPGEPLLSRSLSSLRGCWAADLVSAVEDYWLMRMNLHLLHVH